MIYRKRGSVLRWENGSLIHVREEGIAREDRGVFECEPTTARGAGFAFDPIDLRAVAREVVNAAAGVEIERLMIVYGRSEHEYGERRWQDSTRRIHVALTHARIRVLVDLASFEVGEIADAARALRSVDTTITSVPSAMRIAPRVTAALLPLYMGQAPEACQIVQTAGGVDGYGEPIVEAEAGWPNVFRPSYRVPPRRVPMNVRIEAMGSPIDPALPSAVALLGASPDGAVRLLVEDGGRSWPIEIRIGRVRSVSPPTRWYPYAAGSFGAEMML